MGKADGQGQRGKVNIGFVYTSVDKQAAESISTRMREDGYAVFPLEESLSDEGKRKIKSASAVLLYVTPAFSDSDAAKEIIEFAVSEKKNLLSIYPEEPTQPSALQMVLNTFQGIFRSNYKTDDEFFNRLYHSEALRPPKKPWGPIIAILLIVLMIATAAVIWTIKPFAFMNPTATPTLTFTPSPTATQTPIPTLDPVESAYWEEKYGIVVNKESDFAAITSIRMIGDTVPDPLISFYDVEDEHCIYNRKLVNDGTINSIDDLAVFPNLRTLILPCQQISDISVLANLSALTEVDLSMNEIKSLEGINQLPNLYSLKVGNNPLTTLQGLEGLSGLSSLSIEGTQIHDLSILDAIKFTKRPSLNLNDIPCNDFSALGSIEKFNRLSFSNTYYSLLLPYIDGKSIVRLEMNSAGLTSLDQLGTITDLKELSVGDNNLTNLAGLQNLSQLKVIRLNWNQGISSLDGIEQLTELEELSLEGCKEITDFSNLSTLNQLNWIQASREHRESIEALKTNKWDVSYYPVIEDSGIENVLREKLDLYYLENSDLVLIDSLDVIGNRSFDPENDAYWAGSESCQLNDEVVSPYAVRSFSDFSYFPNLRELTLLCENANDLSPLLEASSLQKLTVSKDMESAVEMIRKEADFEIVVEEPLLSDGGLQLAVQKTLKKNTLTNVDLDRVTELHLFGGEIFDQENDTYSSEDGLTLLNGKEVERGQIRDLSEAAKLHNLERLTLIYQSVDDLSPLLSVSSLKELIVSEDMEEMAKEIELDAGFDITVLPFRIQSLQMKDKSLAEMLALITGHNDLSRSDLAKITELNIAGNQVFDPDETYVEVRDGVCYIDGEEIPSGTIHDLSDLQYLVNLEKVHLECQDIVDITALSFLENLEQIGFKGNPLSSIDGIQTLQKLNSMDISYTDVADLSPLETIDFTSLDRRFEIRMKQIPCSDFSPLEKIPEFSYVEIQGTPYEQIVPYISGKKLDNLFIQDSGMKDLLPLSDVIIKDSLDIMDSGLTSLEGIEKNPSLQEIQIQWNPEIDDLSPLLLISGLKKVRISGNMIPAASTIEKEAAFDIFVDDPFEDWRLDDAIREWNGGNDDIELQTLNSISEIGIIGDQIFDPQTEDYFIGQDKCLLNGEEIERVWIDNLAGLSALTNLEKLTLMCIENDNFDQLSSLPALKTLTVSSDMSEVVDRFRGQTPFEIIVDEPLISDEGLMTAVQQILGKGKIEADDLPQIKSLSLFGSSVFDSENDHYENREDGTIYLNDEKAQPGTLTDLSVLEKFSSLEILTLLYQNVQDLSPLLNLPNLKSLTVSAEMQPLTEAIASQAAFSITINPFFPQAAVFADPSFEKAVKNVTGLTNITKNDLEQIEEFYLFADQPFNPEQDNGWGSVTECYLNGQRVNRGTLSNFADLEQLTNLRRLTLECENITDLSPVGKLKYLEELNLREGTYSSLSGMEQLTNLRKMDLSNSGLSDISAFAQMKFSDDPLELHLENTNISDYQALSSIRTIQFLGVSKVDLESLKDTLQESELYGLMIIETPMTDFKALSGFHIRNHINIYKCGLTSLDGIEAFPLLDSLYLRENAGLKDLSPLLALPNLRELVISPDMQEAGDAIKDQAHFDIRVE